jgi:hypothetical protein
MPDYNSLCCLLLVQNAGSAVLSKFIPEVDASLPLLVVLDANTAQKSGISSLDTLQLAVVSSFAM